MKLNRAGDVRFGDYVRHLQEVCRDFRAKVAYYRAFNDLVKRQPKKFKVEWSHRWCFYYEKDSQGHWNLHNTPMYIGDGKDDILSYRLYYDDELRTMDPLHVEEA